MDPEDGTTMKFMDLPSGQHICTGLTWDGDYLWFAYLAGWSSKVVRIDTVSGNIDTSFFCDAEGLAFDGTYLWNVDSQDGYYEGFVKKREIPSGSVIEYFITPGYFPTGLTFDGSFYWLSDNGTDSLCKIQLLIAGVKDNQQNIPHKAVLFQNFPNPFNSATTIRYELLEASYVSLVIYDFLDREVRTLLDNREDAGFKSVIWDGKDNDGNIASAGIYIYMLRAWSQESEKSYSMTRKMILLR